MYVYILITRMVKYRYIGEEILEKTLREQSFFTVMYRKMLKGATNYSAEFSVCLKEFGKGTSMFK